MSADTIHLSRSASAVRFSVWIACGATILLLVLGVVLWFLPRWAPVWVAEHSPSFAYAWLSVPHDPDLVAHQTISERLSHWQGEPARVLRRKLERHDRTKEIDEQVTELLAHLCNQEDLVVLAEQRLPPGQARKQVELMCELGRDDLLAANLWLLNHVDQEYRYQAVDNLGMLRDHRARVALEDQLSDHYTDEAAARALGRLGDAASVPALVRHLHGLERNDPEPAWNSLVWLADRPTDEQLIDLLTARLLWVRHEALTLVHDQISDAVLGVLVRMAVNPIHMLARRSREHLPSLAKDRMHVLVAWLRSEDEALRRGSITVLSDLADVRAVAPLLDQLATDAFPDPQVERALLANLPADDDRALLEGLAHPSPIVRAWVTRQIGLRGLPGSAEALLLRTADPAPEVRAAILRALGMMRVREARPQCEQALGAATVEERVGAIRALGDLGERSAITLIRPHLQATEAKERQASAQTLGQLGQQEDAALQDELRLLLEDPVPTVQEAARAALERLSRDAAELQALEQQRLLEFGAPRTGPGDVR